MARFAKIGVGPGKTLDVDALTPELRAAYTQGIADAWEEYTRFKQEKMDTGQLLSGDIFGSRAFLKNNYLYRMAAAILGIYGNSKEEAMYPMYLVDAAGQPLSGANKYTIHFPPEQLPPVHAFWSLTMYQLPTSLLVANPIDRYLLNSPMLPQFVKDPDGGLTFYIQNESPGPTRGKLAARADRALRGGDAALLAEGRSAQRHLEGSVDDARLMPSEVRIR